MVREELLRNRAGEGAELLESRDRQVIVGGRGQPEGG
jgi:hypothetical protein